MNTWYSITASQVEKAVSKALFPKAAVEFDSAKERNTGLPGPAELLLTSLAACTLKNLERFSEILSFKYDFAEITVEGERQEAPPKFIRFRYVLSIKTNEASARIELLKKNIEKYGTIYNTLAAATPIEGTISRISGAEG